MNTSEKFNSADLIETPINDATVTGEESADWRTLLDRQMTFLLPVNRNKDAEQKTWKNATARFEDWLKGDLTMHVERPRKGYFPMVFGASAGTKRAANAMKSVECLTLDIDSGDSYGKALGRVAGLGLACIGYTSFNNGTERSYLDRDAVMKGRDTDPTDAEIREFMTASGKYTPEHIATVEIEAQAEHTEDGVKIVLRHAPLEKWRLIFPLAETVTITALAPRHKAALDVFKRRMRGLAQLIGVRADESCFDVSRAFYLPSHPKGSEWALDVIRGRGLTFEELPEASGKNAFEIAGGDAGKRVEAPSGASLKAWATEYARRFEIETLLEGSAYDRGRGMGVLVVECPFDHAHGNAGDADDSACHVRNGDGDTGFSWACKHDSCREKDRLDMLAEALAAGWFDESDIRDDAYLVPLSDQELAEIEAAKVAPFEPVADWLPNAYKMKAGTIYLADEEGDVPLCQAFDVVGRASNLAGDAGAGRIIHFENENGAPVEITLSMADLIRDGGGGVLEVLADAGMRLYVGGKKSRDAVLNLFRQIAPKRQIATVPRPGWVRDRGGNIAGYLCPTGEYIAVAGAIPYRLSTAATVKDRQPMGTLAGWQAAADAAFAPIGDAAPNFFWIVGLSAAFAGPLLSLAGMDACGFNFSGESSKGKTLALILGTTAWTTPRDKKGVLFTMNATSNALEDLAAIGSESFLALDELGAMQRPQDLASILFGLSTGAGKSRKAGRGAGLADDAEFQSFAVMTNERSLRALITGAGGDYKTGISARFPDLDVTAGARVSADVIKRMESAKSNFGHAGPEFVRWLIRENWHVRGHDLRKRIDEAATALAGDVNPAQARAAKVFGLVQIAGELACEAGILSDSAKVKAAVVTAWETFKASDEGKATEGETSLLEGFRSWLMRAIGREVIATEDREDPRFRDVVGWYTDTQFILDWHSITDVKRLGLNGTRAGLVKALETCGALEKSGKNNAHNKLPPEVGGGEVRNIRLHRDKLGLPPDRRQNAYSEGGKGAR
ncbi:DUF927 domain-containing protein [Defluviimonas sp. SAOS-178_SWC]|uniref:DUF927 domain-containing protein n=1 Tax=Defluviimonas sp. SAOS-178_SWC TaxID=3121287 RepID=UPI0032221BA0